MKTVRQILLSLVLLASSLLASDRSERHVVRREDPEYPTIAARMNLHGAVKLKLWISPDGSVRRLEYIGGHPLLAESALKAVKNWKYEAVAKESIVIVELKF